MCKLFIYIYFKTNYTIFCFFSLYFIMMSYLIFIFFILTFVAVNEEICNMESNRKIKVKNFNDFINLKIYENTVLIAEFEDYHLECLPGLTKYFII